MEQKGNNLSDERIGKLEDKFERDQEKVWQAISTLTTDVAVMANNVNNFIKSQESVTFPCPHGQQLNKELITHIQEHNDSKRDWRSFAFRIAGGVILLIASTAIGAGIGFLMGKHAEVVIEENK